MDYAGVRRRGGIVVITCNMRPTMTHKMQDRKATGEELFRDAELKEERGDLCGALRSLLAAAKLGELLSPLNVGNFYAAGRGVGKNPKEAARWYKRAYREGNSAGALNLAVGLENQGNLRNAVVWLKRAIAMNDGDSHLRLARIYLKRRNGTKAAVDLLNRAISLSPTDISDEAREQAQELLEKVDRASKS